MDIIVTKITRLTVNLFRLFFPGKICFPWSKFTQHRGANILNLVHGKQRSVIVFVSKKRTQSIDQSF